jgi:putative hemolysin
MSAEDLKGEEGAGQASRLQVRLANGADEIRAAQALRYRVFYEEMGAKPSAQMALTHSDFDDFDQVCDHLLVLDPDLGPGAAAVVGTYRLMPRAKGEAFGRFYTAGEYDISPVLKHGGNFMELGRSCVDARYRTRSTMNLLWSGIASYVRENNIELMFGCASLPGTDTAALATHLSYLYHWHLAPEEMRPRALAHLYTPMNLLPKDQIDPRRALADLPPLVKGYLRLGGYVGDGAVIDHQFNTTDVCVIVKTELVSGKYVKHYNRKTRDVTGA